MVRASQSGNRIFAMLRYSGQQFISGIGPNAWPPLTWASASAGAGPGAGKGRFDEIDFIDVVDTSGIAYLGMRKPHRSDDSLSIIRASDGKVMGDFPLKVGRYKEFKPLITSSSGSAWALKEDEWVLRDVQDVSLRGQDDWRKLSQVPVPEADAVLRDFDGVQQ